MLVAGTHGIVLRICLGSDLTGYTALRLFITSPEGVRLERMPALGAVAVMDGGELLAANTYIEYATVAEDFPQPGRYVLQAQADFGAPKRLLTVSELFEALP